MEIRESTNIDNKQSRITQIHTIAYSKSHRDNGVVQARGKIDDEANCLSTGDGCGNQSTQNFVFTKDESVRPKVIGTADVNRGEDSWNGPRDGYQIYDKESVSPALRVTQPGGVRIVEEESMAVQDCVVTHYGFKNKPHEPMAVDIEDHNIRIRKLTPVECERLMSWPDNWTKFGTDENGETYELSNSARYKACGNGIVSNIPKALLDHVTGSEQGLRVFSTFAGVDGSGLYLESPKYIKVGFSEFEPATKAQHAANVLRYHYPNVPNLGDITKINVADVPDHDIIFISAPCQDFSSAGRNLGIEGTKGTLFYESARIMKAKRPKYFIFENVKGLLSKKHERTFEIMCEVYSSLGYEIDFELINAKHWNVAQNRERVFMIGRLKWI